MIRRYRVRNREVELEELPDVIAVRGEVEGDRVRGIDGQAPFEHGGWHFLKRTPRLDASVGKRKATAHLYRKLRSGQLVLNVNRATVKFKGDVQRGEIDSAVRDAGATVVEPFPMATNLFTVQFERDSDLFAGLEHLSALPICEFAEPELLEELSAR